MEMLEAMTRCVPGGYVARKAHPDRRYFKSYGGLFYEAAEVDQADFTSADWEHHPPCTGDLRRTC